MGMYTEIFFRANIKADAPIIPLLETWVNDRNQLWNPERSELPHHELFDTPRWDSLAGNDDAYFPHAYGSSFYKNDYGPGYTLALHCTLKNYLSEIGLFFDWIDEHVNESQGVFLGHEIYEDAPPGTPPLAYFKR